MRVGVTVLAGDLAQLERNVSNAEVRRPRQRWQSSARTVARPARDLGMSPFQGHAKSRVRRRREEARHPAGHTMTRFACATIRARRELTSMGVEMTGRTLIVPRSHDLVRAARVTRRTLHVHVCASQWVPGAIVIESAKTTASQLTNREAAGVVTGRACAREPARMWIGVT